jgi:hypothetical protein
VQDHSLPDCSGQEGETMMGITEFVNCYEDSICPASLTLPTAFWTATVGFAVIDVPLVLVLVLFLSRTNFLTLKRETVVSALAIWDGLWLWAVTAYWHAVYSYFFPSRVRWYLPIAWGVLFGLAGLGLWSVAVRLRINPVITFVILGALLGPVTHTWAVSRGLMTKPHMLRSASPFTAVVVSAPEFGFYWCAPLVLAVLLRHAGEALARWDS